MKPKKYIEDLMYQVGVFCPELVNRAEKNAKKINYEVIQKIAESLGQVIEINNRLIKIKNLQSPFAEATLTLENHPNFEIILNLQKDKQKLSDLTKLPIDKNGTLNISNSFHQIQNGLETEINIKGFSIRGQLKTEGFFESDVIVIMARINVQSPLNWFK